MSQRVLGVTGSVGAGKSTVCQLLASRGWEWLDVDDVAALALEDAREAVAECLYAYEHAAPAGASIDKGKLIVAMMKDPVLRLRVESELRPYVLARIERWAGALVRPGVLESALLFEAGLVACCTQTLCVCCAAEERRRRVTARVGASAHHFEAIEAAQWPEAKKAAQADALLHADGEPGQLEERLIAVLAALDGVASSSG